MNSEISLCAYYLLRQKKIYCFLFYVYVWVHLAVRVVVRIAVRVAVRLAVHFVAHIEPQENKKQTHGLFFGAT